MSESTSIRANDATIDVRSGPTHNPADTVDQVRNGNRWRVAAIDPHTNRVAAERLADRARAVFDGDYLKEHVTLVCDDGAFGAGDDRRILPRAARRGSVTGDAVCGDDARPAQQ